MVFEGAYFVGLRLGRLSRIAIAAADARSTSVHGNTRPGFGHWLAIAPHALARNKRLLGDALGVRLPSSALPPSLMTHCRVWRV